MQRVYLGCAESRSSTRQAKDYFVSGRKYIRVWYTQSCTLLKEGGIPALRGMPGPASAERRRSGCGASDPATN